jgi:2-methylisocitrate lyase-like PEP mutase family enzyme
LLFNWAEGGKTPPVSLTRLHELGFRIVIFPISALLIATQAISKALETIKLQGTPVSVMAHMTPFRDFVNSLGFVEFREVEKRFGQFSQ